MRDKPCICGWKFPGFHVCIDPSKPVDPEIAKKHTKRHNNYVLSTSHSTALKQSVNDRWARHREETAERDEAIVEEYKKGEKGIKNIARDFGIAYQTCVGVVRRAADRGELVMRPRGHNVRWEQQRSDDGILA